MWRSWLARCVRDAEVGCSSHLIPTKFYPPIIPLGGMDAVVSYPLLGPPQGEEESRCYYIPPPLYFPGGERRHDTTVFPFAKANPTRVGRLMTTCFRLLYVSLSGSWVISPTFKALSFWVHSLRKHEPQRSSDDDILPLTLCFSWWFLESFVKTSSY